MHLRYQKSTRKEKSLILDEFCQVFKVTRKHAIKLINEIPMPAGSNVGAKQIFGAKLAHQLHILWPQMNQMCGKKMPAKPWLAEVLTISGCPTTLDADI